MNPDDLMPLLFDVLTASDLTEGEDYIYRFGYDSKDGSKVYITIEDVGAQTIELYALSLTRFA